VAIPLLVNVLDSDAVKWGSGSWREKKRRGGKLVKVRSNVLGR